ncbi:MAG TPA: winged helix-turn-helix domain-containing protein [Roseiarcus sp.]|nr:winged helix-turn-helix domain-containing protein [Roseiarcus sp.]
MTDQIVMGVKRQIDDRQLRPGTRLPSIRTFAETHGVSRFTVIEAYDRLVAMGCLQSRRGAGFYVAARCEGAVPAAAEAHRHNEQLVWLIRRLLEAGDMRRSRVVRGCPIPGRTNPASARPSARSRARTARICSNMATLSAICHCANTSR